MITVNIMKDNVEYIGSDPAIIAKAVRTETREEVIDPFEKQIKKIKDLQAIKDELNKGFIFEDNTYAMDDTSMMQYTMMYVLEHNKTQEPIIVADINNVEVQLSVTKYCEFCNAIGRKYKELVNSYAAREMAE